MASANIEFQDPAENNVLGDVCMELAEAISQHRICAVIRKVFLKKITELLLSVEMPALTSYLPG